MKGALANFKFLLVIRIVLGSVFSYAGLIKFFDTSSFADSIASFRLLPDELIGILALTLPPLELIIGLMLISGWKVRPAALCAIFLCATFVIALGQALLRGLNIDCGCLGSKNGLAN